MPEHQIVDTSSFSDIAYQRYILQGVSRTFALTIPQLPNALETAVGNAYLLCRIADTIEDASELSATQKQSLSRLFLRTIQGAVAASTFSDQLLPLLTADTPAAERDLICNTDRVIRLTHSLNSTQQATLSRGVTIMLDGMAYFQSIDTGDGLSDLAAFNSYCYHVAGVVGEILTELYCDYSEAIAQQRDIMMPLAVSFGQGLQMTNILKDVWNDLDRGACWLPKSLMLKHGIDPKRLSAANGSPEFQHLLEELLGIAHEHLQNALRYTLMIPQQETGLRRFCLWAIGMALLTLQRLHENPAYQHSSDVKISRRSLKLTIFMCNTFTRWDQGLSWLFRLAGRGLPKHLVDQSKSAARQPAASAPEQLRVAYRLQPKHAERNSSPPESRQLISH